jgi:hypothetical protein
LASVSLTRKDVAGGGSGKIIRASLGALGRRAVAAVLALALIGGVEWWFIHRPEQVLTLPAAM